MAATSDVVREAIRTMEELIGRMNNVKDMLVDRFNQLHEMEVQTAGVADASLPTNRPADETPLPEPQTPMAHVGEGNHAPDDNRPAVQPEEHPTDQQHPLDALMNKAP